MESILGGDSVHVSVGESEISELSDSASPNIKEQIYCSVKFGHHIKNYEMYYLIFILTRNWKVCIDFVIIVGVSFQQSSFKNNIFVLYFLHFL